MYWVSVVSSRARSGQLGGEYTALIVRVSVVVGMFTAVTSSAASRGRFALL
jgi:hypothetical protein